MSATTCTHGVLKKYIAALSLGELVSLHQWLGKLIARVSVNTFDGQACSCNPASRTNTTEITS